MVTSNVFLFTRKVTADFGILYRVSGVSAAATMVASEEEGK
jgi:hypothetical protein